MALVDVKALLVFVCLSIERSTSLHCFECQGKPHLGNCWIVTECSPNEICYVEKHVDTGGHVYFDSGCRHVLTCNQFALVGKRDTVLSRRNENTTCAQCCDKPFCNDQGCGEFAILQPERGPYCFSCVIQRDPGDCRDVQRCDTNQLCLFQRVKENNGYPEHYTSSCLSEHVTYFKTNKLVTSIIY